MSLSSLTLHADAIAATIRYAFLPLDDFRVTMRLSAAIILFFRWLFLPRWKDFRYYAVDIRLLFSMLARAAYFRHTAATSLLFRRCHFRWCPPLRHWYIRGYFTAIRFSPPHFPSMIIRRRYFFSDVSLRADAWVEFSLLFHADAIIATISLFAVRWLFSPPQFRHATTLLRFRCHWLRYAKRFSIVFFFLPSLLLTMSLLVTFFFHADTDVITISWLFRFLRLRFSHFRLMPPVTLIFLRITAITMLRRRHFRWLTPGLSLMPLRRHVIRWAMLSVWYCCHCFDADCCWLRRRWYATSVELRRRRHWSCRCCQMITLICWLLIFAMLGFISLWYLSIALRWWWLRHAAADYRYACRLLATLRLLMLPCLLCRLPSCLIRWSSDYFFFRYYAWLFRRHDAGYWCHTLLHAVFLPLILLLPPSMIIFLMFFAYCFRSMLPPLRHYYCCRWYASGFRHELYRRRHFISADCWCPPFATPFADDYFRLIISVTPSTLSAQRLMPAIIFRCRWLPRFISIISSPIFRRHAIDDASLRWWATLHVIIFTFSDVFSAAITLFLLPLTLIAVTRLRWLLSSLVILLLRFSQWVNNVTVW